MSSPPSISDACILCLRQHISGVSIFPPPIQSFVDYLRTKGTDMHHMMGTSSNGNSSAGCPSSAPLDGQINLPPSSLTASFQQQQQNEAGISADLLQQMQLEPSCSSSSVLTPAFVVPTPNECKITLDLTFDLLTPETLRFAQSLRTLENGMRALVNLIGDQKGVFRERKLQLITHGEHVRLERGNIRLVFTLVREHFPQLAQLSQEAQVAFLKAYTSQLLGMRRVVMTEHTLPDSLPSFRFVILHPGCVLDRLNLDYFYTKTEATAERNRMLSEVLERFQRFGRNKLRPLDVSPLELAALTGIQFWTCVGQFFPMNPETDSKRNALFRELFSLAAQRCNGDAGAMAVRFGQLLALLQDIAVLTRDLAEFIAMAKIFYGTDSDIWADMFKEQEPPPSTTRG